MNVWIMLNKLFYVLEQAFSYATFCKAMEEVTGFSMKDSLFAP